MSNNRPIFRDPYRVSIHEKQKILYLSKQFKIKPEEIKKAIIESGPLVSEVEKKLGRTSADFHIS